MTIRFNAIGVTLDRRTVSQLESARVIEQQRLDLAVEAEWRRRVRENERRRALYRARQAQKNMVLQRSRNRTSDEALGAGCVRTGT
jgi:hypothetical protein